MNVAIDRLEGNVIRVVDTNTGEKITSNTVEANLQYAILQKLNELKVIGLDVQDLLSGDNQSE